jgi:hypothetical protein
MPLSQQRKESETRASTHTANTSADRSTCETLATPGKMNSKASSCQSTVQHDQPHAHKTSTQCVLSGTHNHLLCTRRRHVEKQGMYTAVDASTVKHAYAARI